MEICENIPHSTVRTMLDLIEKSFAEDKEYGSVITSARELDGITVGSQRQVSLPLQSPSFHTHPGGHSNPSAADIRLSIMGNKGFFCIGSKSGSRPMVKCFINRETNANYQGIKQRMMQLQKAVDSYWATMQTKYGDVTSRGSIQDERDKSQGKELLDKRFSLSKETVENIDKYLDVCELRL